MVLKSIRLRGFKSFPETIEIKFETGITAIVGPNGSGKSNIADAIRWVLGEQSAKQLRGSRMEEVIFGGTENRRPLSFCEAILTLDNTDDRLGLGTPEVSITRRLYRTGESEYLLNQNACRLKDIVDLLRDTGAGREGYSVIGQGRIDEILSNRAEDRRAVFEEAAGIAKYKARKTEAERKLTSTTEHLTRVDDILVELQGQIEPLRQQSQTAREYLMLAEQLRYDELNLFILQQDKANAALHELAQKIEVLQANQRRYVADGVALEAREQANTVALQKAEEDAKLAQLALTSMAETRGNAQANVRVWEERLANGEQQRFRMETQGQELAQKREALSLAIDQAGEKAVLLQKDFELKQAELQTAEAALAQLADQLCADEEKAAQAREMMMQNLNRMSDLRAQISHLQGLDASMAARGEDMQRLVDETKAKREQSEQDVASARAALTVGLGERSREAATVQERADGVARAQEAWRQAQQAQQKQAEAMQAMRVRLKMLEDLKRDHEGYGQAVRALLRDSAQDAQLSAKVCGVVAQMIEVPQKLEIAIELALGAAMQHVITPTDTDAKQLVEYLRRNQLGRVTFLPMNAVRTRTLNDTERNWAQGAGILGVASECVECQPQYRDIVRNLLGRTVLVEDMDTGLALARKSQQSIRIVTLQGDMMNVGGSITGGSVQARAGGLFSRERERNALRQQAESAGQIEVRLVAETAKAEAEWNAAKVEHQKAVEGQSQAEARVHALREREQITLETLQERQLREQEMLAEQQRMVDMQQDTATQIAGMQALIDRAGQGDAEGTAKAEADQDAFSQARARHTQMQSQAVRLQVEQAQAQSAIRQQQQEQSRLTRELQDLKLQGQRQQQAGQDGELQLEQIRQALEECRQAAQSNDAAQQHAQARAEACENARQAAFAAYAQGEKNRQQQITQLAECEQQMMRSQTQSERLVTERENATARIFESYQLTYADILPLRDEAFLVDGASNRVGSTRAKIRAMGSVNVNAVEDFVALEARVGEMSTQRADLQQAFEDLGKLIERLEKRMVERFREAFAEINQAFGVSFKKLFDGGHAHLALMDEHNWLNSGIEIIAQPPGTKMQSLTLLSGGQRALTAIALLFAMLKINPTPFCVLDEIEAALDEANVEHYAKTLHEYTQKTQFVVITHRKGTMEAADALYGITMQEKGVSSLVSVRLQHATP